MSGRIASIDSVEHAALVLKSLRKSSSQSRYGAGGGVSLGAFDELVSKTAQELSERVKMEQRMESLIAQDPTLHAASHSPALVLHQSKDLNTPLELSPGKYKAMFKASRVGGDGAPPLMLDAANEKRGKHRRGRIGGGSSSNNNNNDDDGDIDFSSDDEDTTYPSGLNGSGGGKLERVALNRPTKSGAKASGRTQNDEEDDDDDDAAAMRALAHEAGMDGGGSPSAKSSSFYDAEETLDSDDEDNAALFKGFTAPTISADSEFAAQLSKASPSPASLSLRGSSHGGLGGSVGGGGVGSGGGASGVRVAKPPAVPATNTTKDLTSRGVVVGKRGIFIRAGGRRKGGVS